MGVGHNQIREAPVLVMTGEIEPTPSAREGGPGAGFAGAARVVEAEYEWPFQSLAGMRPACALGLRQDKVHGIWVPGRGSYGATMPPMLGSRRHCCRRRLAGARPGHVL